MQIKKSPYRWVILILLTIGTMMLNYSNIIFAARGAEILDVYQCSATQLAAITSISFLPGVFLSVLVGRMIDKKGSKLILFIFVALTAVFFLLRVLVHNYWVLFLCTLGAGITLVPTGVAPAKMLRAWFPDNEMQIAFGIYGNAPGLGTTLAFATVGVFSGVTGALLFIGIVAAVLAVLWIVLGKNTPATGSFGQTTEQLPAPEKGALGRMLRNKHIWYMIIGSFVGCGGCLVFNTHIVMALGAKGLGDSAPAISTTMNTLLLVGGILSGFIVGAIKRINIPYLVQCLVGAGIFVLFWFLPAGKLTSICIFVGAFIFSGNINVMMSRVSLLPMTGEVSVADLGILNGICNTAISLGGFSLPIIVTAICERADGVNYSLLFLIVFALYAIAGILGMLIPELGEKGKLAQQAKQKAQ